MSECFVDEVVARARHAAFRSLMHLEDRLASAGLAEPERSRTERARDVLLGVYRELHALVRDGDAAAR